MIPWHVLTRITENRIEKIRVEFIGVKLIIPPVDVMFESTASKISEPPDKN
jgi:hypothetical protein